MDDVFRALADPSRRMLLDRLHERGGQRLRELCEGLDMARQSVSKHLAVLEGANLVTTVRSGRDKLHYLNAVPINEIAQRWISRYDQGRLDALDDLKRALEDTVTEPGRFVYTTYIRTTPAKLFEALTDPAFTRRWWSAISIESEWRPGASMTWDFAGTKVDDPDQVVLEYDPPRRIAYTWVTMLAGDDDTMPLGNDPRSKVSFDLEPRGELVQLTVVHDDLIEGTVVAARVSKGWPEALSSLKSFLETGEGLPRAH